MNKPSIKIIQNQAGATSVATALSDIVYEAWDQLDDDTKSYVMEILNDNNIEYN